VIVGSPGEGQQSQAEREARLDSPEAVAEREASRTRFEGLDAQRAAKVAGEVFPGVLDEPAGGPPRLSAGQSIVSYPSDEAARVAEKQRQAKEVAATQCVVPSLMGDSLKAATSAFGKVHCRLGKVTRPRSHHGSIVVTRQGYKRGARLAQGTLVAVSLGPKRV
jgi:hypothetical protein